MIKRKKKICVECGREDYIFSKGRCKYCASKSYAKKTQKRKNVDLTVFFKEQERELSKNLYCEECGVKLNPTFLRSNIAHILPKSKYKSIANNELNILYLCSFKDNGNNCHSKFDNGGNNKRLGMKVFNKALNRVKEMLDKGLIKESGSELNFFKKHLVD